MYFAPGSGLRGFPPLAARNQAAVWSWRPPERKQQRPAPDGPRRQSALLEPRPHLEQPADVRLALLVGHPIAHIQRQQHLAEAPRPHVPFEPTNSRIAPSASPVRRGRDRLSHPRQLRIGATHVEVHVLGHAR